MLRRLQISPMEMLWSLCMALSPRMSEAMSFGFSATLTSSGPCGSQSGQGTFPNQIALELCQSGKQMKDEFARVMSSIDLLV